MFVDMLVVVFAFITRSPFLHTNDPRCGLCMSIYFMWLLPNQLYVFSKHDYTFIVLIAHI